jgi:DNA-binding GntR family transcriptional regulator
LTETAGQEGTPSRRLLFTGLAPAPEAIAERMGVAAGAGLLTRRRLMLIDDAPLRLATSYFLPDTPEAEELSGDAFLGAGLQDLFNRHGRTFGAAEETLVARMPSTDEAAILQIPQGDPVVEITRTSLDSNRVPVHTLQTICVGSRHLFVVRQSGDDKAF